MDEDGHQVEYIEENDDPNMFNEEHEVKCSISLFFILEGGGVVNFDFSKIWQKYKVKLLHLNLSIYLHILNIKVYFKYSLDMHK